MCICTEEILSSASLRVELRDLKKVSEVLRRFHELTEVGESLLPISRRPMWPVWLLCKEASRVRGVYNVVWCFGHAAAALKLGFFMTELPVVPGKVSVGCADGYQSLKNMSWKCKLWRCFGVIGETPPS